MHASPCAHKKSGHLAADFVDAQLLNDASSAHSTADKCALQIKSVSTMQCTQVCAAIIAYTTRLLVGSEILWSPSTAATSHVKIKCMGGVRTYQALWNKHKAFCTLPAHKMEVYHLLQMFPGQGIWNRSDHYHSHQFFYWICMCRRNPTILHEPVQPINEWFHQDTCVITLLPWMHWPGYFYNRLYSISWHLPIVCT